MLIRKVFIVGWVAFFTVAALAFPVGDGITRRVRFARGKTSITFENSVLRGDRDTYIVRARAGQRLTVRVTALEKNAAFQIERPNGSFLEGAGDADDAASVRALLPEAGDYRVIVGGTRGNASYRLTIWLR